MEIINKINKSNILNYIEIANKLNIKKLGFNINNFEKIDDLIELIQKYKIDELFEYEIILQIDIKDLQKVKTKIKNKKVKYLYKAEKEEFVSNFKFIIKNYNYICNLECIEKWDYFNQIRSGTNENILRNFNENNITIIVEFNNLMPYIHRIQQNYNLAKKFNIDFQICSFAKNEYELLDENDKSEILKF
mgnify:CR=1 FL=1